MHFKFLKNSKAFTLLEILLVVGIISLLAGIVIVAINPGKQLATVRNAQRKSDIKQLNSAITQYYISTGRYPTSLPTTLKEVCATGNLSTTTDSGITCGSNLVDLTVLVPTYITSIPVDPQGPTETALNPFINTVHAATDGTGYYVMKDSTNKIVVNTEKAELGAVIAIGTTTAMGEVVEGEPEPELWTPAELTDLALWLDASDASTLWSDTAGTIPATNGGSVERWNDKSGISNYCVKHSDPSPVYRTTGFTSSKPAVVFGENGRSSLILQNNISTSNALFVSSVYSTTNYTWILGSAGGTATRVLGWADSASRISTFIPTGGMYANYTNTSGAVVSSEYNGISYSNIIIRSNGSVLSMLANSYALASAGYRYIGGGLANSVHKHEGPISEVIVVNSVPSILNRQKLEGYLAHKWGLEGNLPSDHPYKTSAPTK